MPRTRPQAPFALALLAATCLTPVAPATAAPGDPVGEEFQVNSTTGVFLGPLVPPAMAVNSRGESVFAWETWHDGRYAVVLRRCNVAGDCQGSEFDADPTTAIDMQAAPSMAMNEDGDFVVAWQALDGDNLGIFARRFDAAGVAQGGKFRVNTFTMDYQTYPAIAMGPNGEFVVTWRSWYQDGDEQGIFAQRYNAVGEPQGGEFQVNTTTEGHQTIPAVAMDAEGNFVIAWTNAYQIDLVGNREYDVYAQRYNSAGEPQGSEFRVNSYTYNRQDYPAVAMDAAGDFVVTWQSRGQDGDGWGIFAQRFNAAGERQAGEFQVNTRTFLDQSRPSVAMDANGDFVVTWAGAFAQRYNSAGQPQGGEFQVNSYSKGSIPNISMRPNGDFLVAWLSFLPNPDFCCPWSVYARRFQGNGHVSGDFDSDGRADILWRNSETGNTVLWRMDGFEHLEAGSIGFAAAPWRAAGIADFDGDYRADVLWRNDDTGDIALWQMDGFVKLAAEPVGKVASPWRIEGLGDFDGDGRADILWRNPGKRNVRIWRMNGFLREDSASIGAVPKVWRLAGVGDFDGDRKADILWRNSETGNTVLWRMDGFTKLAAESIGAPNASWRVAGLGDFDGDTKADILWRNTDTGNTVIWRMDGFTRLASQSIGIVNAAWTLELLRDTDGDGLADIVWRNASTGSTAVWRMSGLTKVAAEPIGSVNADWQLR